MELLDRHIEALIFSTQRSISLKEIRACLELTLDSQFKNDELLNSISNIKEKFDNEEHSFELREIAEGYSFMSKPIFHHTIGTHLKLTNKKNLSKAALETLAIIAYKQPITRIDIEAIRGVNCEYTLHKLLDKELVEIGGRSELPGRPLIYITSLKFMNHFGIKSLKDLPKLKEIVNEENQIGEPAPIEEIETHEAFFESSEE